MSEPEDDLDPGYPLSAGEVLLSLMETGEGPLTPCEYTGWMAEEDPAED